MNKNEKIFNYLKSEKDKALQNFLEAIEEDYEDDDDAIFSKEIIESFEKFKNFDLKSYENSIKNQILINIENEWLHIKNGIKPEEKLQSILFEYEIPYNFNNECYSYGIKDWEDFQLYTTRFDMGFSYNFTSGFECLPGFSIIEIFNVASVVLDDDFDEDPEDILGYYEFFELIEKQLFLSTHNVLKRMHNENCFEKLNIENEFMFLFEMHDGEPTPLLIIEK